MQVTRNFFEQPISLNLVAGFDGVIQRVNRSWAAVLGYSLAELEGASFMELVHPDDQAATRAELDRLSGGEVTVYFENRYRHKQGDYRLLAWSATPSVEEGLVYAVAKDVTERQEMIQRVENLAEFPQQNPNPVMRVSRDGELVYSNSAAKEFRRCGDCQGDNKICATLIKYVEQSFVEGRPVFAERSCGDKVYALCFSAVSDKPFANIYGMEITERKEAEAQLTRLSAAIYSAAEGVIITDAEGVIQYVNPAFESISGYSAEEAIGQSPDIVRSGKHDASFYARLWSTIESGKTWRGRFMNKRKDGSFYVEEGTVASVKDDQGKITNYVAVKRDITHDLAVEQQCRQSQKMESVGQLAGGVAHDLNNLLTPILGYSQILLEDPAVPEEYGMPLEQIAHAGERARDLVQQLLVFSRSSEVEMKPLDLNGVISSFERLIRKSVPENIDISYDLYEQPCFVSGDLGQMGQVLMNLAINAKDAMEAGGHLQIQTRRLELNEPQGQEYGLAAGEYIELSVRDSGTGMEREVLDQIFEPFFTTKEVDRGTGLGLSTVFGIVSNHQGSIRAESVVGQGSVFYVLLPVSRADEDAEIVESEEAVVGEATGEIWLVEDDEMVKEMASLVLQRAGFRVKAFESSIACLSFWEGQQQVPDLLISDVIMPEMNGKQLTEHIRSSQPECKVLFISGYTRDVIFEDDLNEPGISFLAKPFNTHSLLAAVRDALAGSSVG